jgi:Zn-dependent peptidase ImmA (M78 family)
MDLTAIKRLAQEKVHQYNSEGQVPFPFERLTQAVGDLEILYSDNIADNISGAILVTDGSHFNILINSKKPAVRQYFTIAHEVGHYFLHRQWLLDNNQPGFVDYVDLLDTAGMLLRSDEPSTMPEVDLRKEREANNFAAELIMPEDKVRDAWARIHDIEDCADIFQVSRAAMAIRLERLGLSQ